MKTLLWIGILVIGVMPAMAQKEVQDLVVTKDQDRYLPAGSQIGLLQPMQGIKPDELSAAQVTDPRHLFVPLSLVPDSVYEAFLRQPAQWVRLRLRNRNAGQTRFLLDSRANQTQVYLSSATGLRAIVPLDSRQEAFGLGGLYRLEVPPGTEATVYMRMKFTSSASRQIAATLVRDIRLYPEHGYQRRYTRHVIRYALLYGALLVLMVYHLFVFINTRARTYLLFSLFILGLCVFMASNAGYLLALGLDAFPLLNTYLQFCSAPLTILAYLLFGRSYLELKRHSPALNRVTDILAVICLLSVGAVLLGYWNTGRTMGILLTIAGMGFVLYAAIRMAVQGYRPARYFILANSVFLVSALVFSTQQFWGPASALASSGLQIGAVLQVSIVSLGLISRINWVQQQVLLQAAENRRMEQAAARQREELIQLKNQELEQRIRERTAQITEQKEEIEAQNWHLAEMNDRLLNLQETITLQNQTLAGTNQKLEYVVAERTEKLRQTLHELDSFIYRTSHDMRAPLASVMGLVELFQSESDPAEKENYVALIGNSIRKLDKLLVDITQYAKNKKLDLRPQPIEFSVLIQELVDGLKFAKNAQDVDFRISVTQTGIFYSDRERLRSVIGNLLSNAVRYRSHREPFVSITVDASDMARIVVADNGIGIEPEFHNRIFEMFFRLSLQSEGSGLGLYIVQETVTTLGGRITVESAVGQGSAFTLAIPSLLPDATAAEVIPLKAV